MDWDINEMLKEPDYKRRIRVCSFYIPYFTTSLLNAFLDDESLDGCYQEVGMSTPFVVKKLLSNAVVASKGDSDSDTEDED